MHFDFFGTQLARSPGDAALTWQMPSQTVPAHGALAHGGANAFTLAHFMPGYIRPASAKDAARFDIPASGLDNVTAGEIAIAKHEMSRPRKLYGFLYGRKLPSPHDHHRAKLVHMLKERAFDLAAHTVTPGHA